MLGCGKEPYWAWGTICEPLMLILRERPPMTTQPPCKLPVSSSSRNRFEDLPSTRLKILSNTGFASALQQGPVVKLR